jgi:hypothetical protein
MDRRFLIVTATAIAVTFGGCGSSSSLTRAELVKQANAICKRREATLYRVLTTARSRAVVQRKLVPTMDNSVADLAALKPPTSMKARYERFIADQRFRMNRIRRELLGKPNRGPNRGHERYNLIVQLGFRECR